MNGMLFNNNYQYLNYTEPVAVSAEILGTHPSIFLVIIADLVYQFVIKF